MAAAFDPYWEWLKIPLAERPVDFYRLLGVPRFERDPARIAAACDQRMALVRSKQNGPHGVHTQQVLNDLAAARVCLLTAQSKAEYDEWLATPATSGTTPATPQPQPGAPGYASQLPPAFAALPVGPAAPQPSVLPPHLAALQAAPPAAGQWLPSSFPTAPTFSAAPAPPPVAPPKPERPLFTPANKPAAPQATPVEEATAEVEPPPRKPWVAIAIGGVLAVALVGGYLGWRALGGSTAAPSVAENTPVAEPKQPSEPAAPEPPRSILLMQEGTGEVNLTPGAAALHNLASRLDGATETLIAWDGPDSNASWRFKLVKPGFFQAEVTYQAAQPLDLLLTLAEEEPKRVTLRASPGAWQTELVTLAIPRGGERRMTVQVGQAAGADSLVLKAVRLIPVGGAGP